jgi:hypothetical protein
MKNTWVASLETKDVYREMDEQSNILRYLYHTDNDGYQAAVQNICKVVIDEFWREEAFEEGDYRMHMMHWKEIMKPNISNLILDLSGEKNILDHEDMLDHIMTGILLEISTYLEACNQMWKGDYSYGCDCPVCDS